MRSNITLFISILLLTGFIVSNNTLASEQDEKEVKEAVSQFYVALNKMFKGNIDPMKEVWSHADDVTYMGPTGGMKVGWELVSCRLGSTGCHETWRNCQS